MNQETLDKLNQYANLEINHYHNLNILNQKVHTPYYINKISPIFKEFMSKEGVDKETADKVLKRYKNREANYGWYRGKGTSDQLEQAIIELANKLSISIESASSQGIEEYMKLLGLGVDCSGFVFNVLLIAFNQVNMGELYLNNLSWADQQKKDADHAGAFVFTNSASDQVSISELKPLDLLLIKRADDYSHIGVFTKINGALHLSQSNIDFLPSGVHTSQVALNGENIDYGYTPIMANDWTKAEFRRLKILV